MADILIRGIKAPDDCGSCVFCVNEMFDKFCPLSDSYYNWSESSNGSRPDNCPLLPLPEGHGRLIDADALKKRTPMVIDYSAGGFGTDGSIRPVRGYGDWQIDQAPTIVSAEGGGEE